MDCQDAEQLCDEGDKAEVCGRRASCQRVEGAGDRVRRGGEVAVRRPHQEVEREAEGREGHEAGDEP